MSAITHTSLKPDTNDSHKIVLERIAHAAAQAAGEFGGDYYGDTAAHTGQTWSSVQVLSAAVFTTLTGTLNNSIAGVSFPAGTIIYGRFTTITLASGAVVEYRAA